MLNEHDEQELARVLKGAWPLPAPGSPAKAVAAMARAQQARVRQRRRRLIALAAAALAAAAFLARPLLTNRSPLVAVIAARGSVHDASGRELAMGDRLSGGAGVMTGATGRVTLVARRGSEFTLAADSRLEMGADRESVSLESGRLYCRNRAHEFAAISTVAGRIALLGTTVDADTKDKETVAVTVLEGEVRLENAHGQAAVPSGHQALFIASAAPGQGQPVNTLAKTAWYNGRGEVVSEAGDIAYMVPRGDGLAAEVWVMRADGSGKHRVKTYTGGPWGTTGSWLPGGRSLFVTTRSLGWKNPDFAHHRPQLLGYAILEKPAPPLGEREWILDIATGQDAPFALPAGYEALYREVSPDGRLLAFSGRHYPDPKSHEHVEGGIWIYNLTNGVIKKVLNGWLTAPFSWSPGSKLLAASTGEGYGTNYPLVIVDVTTGAVHDLHAQMQGAGASFSPDGTKLAYYGGFQKSGSWFRGVPASGSIFVLDLKAGGKPRRLSPIGEGSLNLRWSPDGKRVLYLTVHSELVGNDHGDSFKLLVANADGSGSKEIYNSEGIVRAAEWAPSGKTVYLVTLSLDSGGHAPRANRIFTVSADGSRRVTDLGGNEKDSILPRAQQADTEAASSDLREAVYQYEVGQIRSYEGRPKEAKAGFRSAADIFASLVYKHPLSGFATRDLAAYADNAQALASQSDEALLRETCKQRVTHYLSWALLLYMGRERRAPPDLATLEQWALKTPWGLRIEWIAYSDRDWVKMFFRCPDGGDYIFHPTPNRAYPKVGDVLVTCPNHPESRLVWTESLAGMLRERLGIERLRAEQARR
jgi:Tol biopolymer transport system component